jgi:hypothetical protein
MQERTRERLQSVASSPEGKKAFYLQCSRKHAFACWLAIGLNLSSIVAFIAWCLVHARDVRPTWLMLSAAAVVGVPCADFFSGVIHWATDSWLKAKTFDRLGAIAEEHHTHPSHLLDYGFRDYTAYMSLPTFLLFGPMCAVTTLALPPSGGLYFFVLVSIEVCALTFFGTYFHKLGHVRSRSRIVRLLQRAGCLITPREHALHHRGDHGTHYCVVTGWMNPVLDRIRFFRRLEKLVFIVTGAAPRPL